MTGVGVGMSIGALAVHARFSQSSDRVAIVSAFLLFFRALGGTVGLAQCNAVLSAKVNSHIASAIRSGAISASDAGKLLQASGALSSLQSINSLPPDVQSLVKAAYQSGTRWAFISLIPWAALACIGTLFLSRIRETPPEPAVSEERPIEVESKTGPEA